MSVKELESEIAAAGLSAAGCLEKSDFVTLLDDHYKRFAAAAVRDKDLYKAADAGNLDDLNKLLAAGADPNGFKNGVRVIAEGGRAPPHPPLCGLVSRRVSARRLSGRIVEFASARVVWFGASSSRRHSNRPSRS